VLERATGMSWEDRQRLCLKYPQLRHLILQCQRLFGTRIFSVMGLASISEAQKRRWAKRPAV
jgi:hypothetical protein